MGMGGAYQLTNNLNRFPLQPKANNSNLKKKHKKKHWSRVVTSGMISIEISLSCFASERLNPGGL